MDAPWKRHDRVASSSRFELPADTRGIGLMADRSSILPFCVINRAVGLSAIKPVNCHPGIHRGAAPWENAAAW